jgi:hypothetical protein
MLIPFKILLKISKPIWISTKTYKIKFCKLTLLQESYRN